VVRGARMQKGLPAIIDPDSEVAGSLSVSLEATLPYASKQTWKPVHLGSTGLIAFGFIAKDAAAPSVTASSGRIVLVREADIRTNIATAGVSGRRFGLVVR
jgi:hypothetical protein